jgi:hypothetical protein
MIYRSLGEFFREAAVLIGSSATWSPFSEPATFR